MLLLLVIRRYHVAGLNYINDRWHPRAVAIGENGLSIPNSPRLHLPDAVHDTLRVEWYRTALQQIQQVLQEGKVPLVGYIFWSCISNFEWIQGYTEDFGVIYARPGRQEKRHVKDSAKFLKASLSKDDPEDATAPGASKGEMSDKASKNGAVRIGSPVWATAALLIPIVIFLAVLGLSGPF